MTPSSVRLGLCFSVLASAFGAHAQLQTTQPWLDRKDIAQPAQEVQLAPSRNLSDFKFGEPVQKRGWMEEMSDRMKSAAPPEESRDLAQNYDMQVFISAGMPEGVLRHLFAQAMDFPKGRVRFVVRGFTPQKLGPLIGKLRGMFPAETSDHIVIEVDPGAFRAYSVESVPVFLVKESSKEGKHKWYEVKGAQSLEAARDNVTRRSDSVMGELYAIAEPDMLSVIEERTKNFNWEPVMARAQARAMQKLKPGFDLPTATSNETRHVTPTFVVPHDIEVPRQDGKGKQLLARAGQSINLLEHTRLQVPVIVFDPSDERQARMVKSWIKRPEYANADLFVVGFDLKAIDAKTPVTIEIAQAYKRPIYPLIDKLNERFGVESVPSIVEQIGKSLRVRTFNPESF